MQPLNFPQYPIRMREKDGRIELFDIIRKRFVKLSPEEWVRQHMIHFLIDVKKCPAGLIAIEKKLKLHDLVKRSDILVHDSSGSPLLIVECKAPEVALNQAVFDQILRYNLALNVKYLVVTNGLLHYCCRIDPLSKNVTFLKDIPVYSELKSC